MVKQYFILGRNPELSYQELLSYNRARNNLVSEIFFIDNYLLLEVKQEVDINFLGGTLKSGIIESEGDELKVEAYIRSNEIIDEDKFTYATFGNLDSDLFKQKFKSEKKKAMLKHGRTKIKFQNNTKVNLPKATHYLILHESKDKIYFGKINQECNTKAIEHRDMKKPVRREELAISPRLAKILVNLSGVKEKQLMFDCFCGVGGIIQEALLNGINCYGIDRDPKAVRDARKNIQWLKSNHKISSSVNIECKDARSVPNKQYDGISTETPLADLYKNKLDDKKAKESVHNFERFIIPILKNLSKVKKKSARIAITFPRIKNFSVDLKVVCKETKLRVVDGPIIESREKQIISREIIVFV